MKTKKTKKTKKTTICIGCNVAFDRFFVKRKKKYNLSKRRYCLKCSPYGQYAKQKKPIVNGKRQCKTCLEWKSLKEFTIRTRGYFRPNCKPCEGKRITSYGQKMKKRSVEYLGGKCSACGYNKCMRSMTFHHLDPNKKDFSLAKKKSLKWETIKAELDKCILVCANCHGEIHAGIFA